MSIEIKIFADIAETNLISVIYYVLECWWPKKWRTRHDTSIFKFFFEFQIENKPVFHWFSLNLTQSNDSFNHMNTRTTLEKFVVQNRISVWC